MCVSLSLTLYPCLSLPVRFHQSSLFIARRKRKLQANKCHKLGKRVIVFLSQIHANNRRWLKERGKKRDKGLGQGWRTVFPPRVSRVFTTFAGCTKLSTLKCILYNRSCRSFATMCVITHAPCIVPPFLALTTPTGLGYR